MLKKTAQLISIVFHPLFAATYFLILLLLINPYSFGFRNLSEGMVLLLQVFITTFFIPFLGVVMLRFLGFIKSMEMHDKQERIGPYIITATFYCWIFINFLKNPNIPELATIGMLGSLLGIFAIFIVNLFGKISAHMAGMGGAVGMTSLVLLESSYQHFFLELPFYGLMEVSVRHFLFFLIVCAGMVGTSRLILGAHRSNEVYMGFIVGCCAQLLAMLIIRNGV